MVSKSMAHRTTLFHQTQMLTLMNFVIHFIAGTQPAVDPKMVSATIPTYASPDGSRAIVGTVQNLGANTLNSFDISWTDGTTTKTATINNSLASGATYDFEHPDEVTVAAGTTSNITVSVEVFR